MSRLGRRQVPRKTLVLISVPLRTLGLEVKH